MAFLLTGYVAGVVLAFTGFAAADATDMPAPPFFIAAIAAIFGGHLWKALFHWAAELLLSHGRAEDIQAEILQHLRAQREEETAAGVDAQP